MDVTVSELMANFMESPLVVWVKTFGPLASNSEDKLSMYMELVDGVFLHKIMTHIDPNPTNHRVNKQVNNDVNLRIQNLSTVIRHVRNYYQEHLQQLILMSLPNVLTIAKDPLSGKSMEEMKRFLLLLLGCAVQCERKGEIIEKIKLLNFETQAAIVSHIQEVTHNQENVLDMQWLEAGELPPEDLNPLSRTMAFHLRKLIDDRDENSELILELTQERDYLQSQQLSSSVNCSSDHSSQPSNLTKEERQHLAVELADTKARLRRSRQELEEKTEQLIDTKNELERLDAEMQKLKHENMQLLAEARSVRAYRDEVDVLRERAGKVDRLEAELVRFKEKLHDVHFYKARLEELRGDNMTLLETKAMLEEQLGTARGRCDKLHELEKENLHLRSKLHDMEIDRDGDKKRLEELLEENMMLEISQKQSMNESAHLGWELEQLAKNNEVNDVRKSFVVEMNESASSRLLKLEKENQSLQSTIQNLREAALLLEDGKLHTVELERENQGISKKLEKLQTQLDQEKQTIKDMENLGEELIKEKQRLKKDLETLSAEKEKQISELEQEKERLNETVNSLRKRAQEDSEARVREVETENRILHQKVSDTESQLVQLDREKQKITKHLEGERECARELQRTVKSLECSQKQLQGELTSLKVAEEQLEALQCKNSILEQENWGLKKDTEELQSDNMRLTLLEKERKKLENENAALRSTVAELRSQARRTERLEIKCSSLDKENQQLQQNLENSSTKIQALKTEVHEAEAQSEELRHELEELRKVARHAEEAEKERRRLEQELGQAEKERKQLEREARRLRQQVDMRESALEESSLKLSSVEKEVTTMNKELAHLQEVAIKVKDLEKENKELQKQVTIDKKTLVTLREELVNEKLRVQQQCNELEKLNHELEKMGLNRERLLQEEHSCEDSKYRILETKIESALKNSVKLREEKIQSLESRLDESSSLNQQLRTELTSVKKTLEALRQRQEEEAAHSEISQKGMGQGRSGTSQEKWETEHREITGELLKLKDRLIDVEKNNASLQTEKQLLKEHLKQLSSQNTQLNAQTLALQKQAATLQEQNTALHKDTAKLQVENSTLKSQNSSLTAQYTVLQTQLQTLEAEAEALLRQREEARASRDGVAQDHERLLSVHERQAAEYEQLISQHTALKSSQRATEQEHRSLESKYLLLLKQTDAVEELEASLQKERENLSEEINKNAQMIEENRRLREEMDRLSQTHTHLRQEYDRLQLQSKELKTSLNETQLELNRWQASFDQLKEQHQGLDISKAKLDNHCELLTRLKGNLEEENHHLLSQIQMLSQQNQTLLERSMESKELYHEEQKQYIDKLNSLRRHKEKLEEKIMDQYKFYDPTPKKKSHWVGAKAIAKLMKPKKEGLRERRDSSRERIRSAPDIPLPDIPHHLDCSADSPTFAAPPLPPRQTSLNLDSPSSLLLDENHTHSSPILTASNHRGLSYSSSSRNSEAYRLAGGSTEDMNGYEELVIQQRALEPAVSCSTPLNNNSHSAPGFSSSISRPGRRPKGLISEADLPMLSLDAGFASGGHGNAGPRPNSADYSRNTSSSSSPVNLKDSLERLQRRSASLSSDDVVGLSRESSTLSRSSLLPRSATLPYEAMAQSRSTPRTTCPRPGSPGSEMVTLEEFLHETNALSPPTVHTGSREDLMTDYFTRAGRPMPPIRDSANTPTSYVTPTIKTAAAIPDGRSSKPGHSVKPSVRLTETSMTLSQSQTLPNRGSSGAGGRSLHLHHSGARGGITGSGSSLSRTFSLASADLLQANGPDCYRSEGGSTMQAEGGVTRKERSLSTRPTGSSGYLSLDHRRLSVASPRADPPLTSSSTALQLERRHTGSGGSSATIHSTNSHHPRGEVALVTPVRVVSVMRQNDVEEDRDTRQTEPSSSSLKKLDSSGTGCLTEERPMSTPSSPDPNTDQQTVWYEYGCV